MSLTRSIDDRYGPVRVFFEVFDRAVAEYQALSRYFGQRRN